MHISIEKIILESMLINIQPFLDKKDISQITSHVLLKITNEKLEIEATDFEIGLKTKTDNLNIIEKGAVTTNGKKFLDIVKRLKNDLIYICQENNSLFIKQGNSKFKLQILNYKEFPKFPNIDKKPKIEINSLKLIEAIKQVTPSIDTNNPKFELNGALIDIKEQYINLVSTDTKRLSIVKLENQSNNNNFSIIIPKKAIIEIQKLFFDDIEIFYDENNLIINSNQYQFFTKLTNGKFPNYERIIPQDKKYNLSYPKNNMIEAIKLITSISNNIKFTFNKNGIILESTSQEGSEAKTEINFENQIETEINIIANSKYILDFLNSINEENFVIIINQSNLPFLLKSENLTVIIMPIII